MTNPLSRQPAHSIPSPQDLWRTALTLTFLISLISANPGLAANKGPVQSAPPSPAADWGYDDAPARPSSHGLGGNGPQTQAAEASPGPVNAPKLQAKTAGKAKATLKNSPASNQSKVPADETSLTPVAAAPPTAEELAARQKTEDLKSWMQIYALTASSASQDDRNNVLNFGTLNADLRKKLEKLTFEKLEKNTPEYRGITAVWQPISAKIVDDIDYKESYRLLFRALLRHALGHMEPASAEAEPIHEILGPTRIAEMGPPVLTEDSINAYSDMTCFLYQKNHPDHTLEGEDNRQLFADVVRQRYNDAPNPQAKKAMCNFDLTWASFRCRFLDSNEAEKSKMLQSISTGSSTDKQKGGSANRDKTAQTNGGSHNNLLPAKILKIFALGPWAEKGQNTDTKALMAEAKSLTPEPKTTPVAAKMNQKSESTK